jgi:hypothetical protein
MRSFTFFFFYNLPNPSGCTMALELTQPLAEISTRNLPRGNGRAVCKADNLAAIYELPQHLTTLCAPTACYRDICTFTSMHHVKTSTFCT